MAFRDRSESAPAPRRKARRSSSKKPTRPQVLAPKPTGVFARPQPKAPDVADRPRAQRKVQRAEDRMPTTTLPVKRLPTLAHPTHRQAAAIVREQRAALKGSTPAAKASAGAGNADRVTRTQVRNAQAAQRKLDHDELVRIGVKEARAHPEKYGFRGTDAYGLAAPTVQMTPQLTRIHGRIKNGDVRGAMALIGAYKKGEAIANTAQSGSVRARAPHGVHAGLEAVAGLKLGKASGILAQASLDASKRAGRHLGKGTGALNDDNAFRNALKDVVHFPYDAVNSGAQTLQAAADVAKYVPHGPREVLGIAGGPAASATATLANVQGGKGSTKKARQIVAGLDEGALGALAGGHLKLAVKRAGEHPLYTAAEFAGAYGAVGRTLGAVTRGTGAAARHLPKGGGKVGAAARGLGDTRRPDLVLEPGARGLRVSRSYSKNLITALEQKRRDRVDTRKGLGDKGGIHFRGTDRARRKAERQAVNEFQDFQQNSGRGEREAARRDAQTASGARVQSRRQAKDVQAEKVRREVIAALRAKGVPKPEGMSALELAKAAEKHGVKVKARRPAREYAAKKGANWKQRGGRLVPTKVGLPRVPFSAKAGASYYVRPERDLLVPAAKQLLGDVRSSTGDVRAALQSEIARLDRAFEEHHAEMDLAGRRRNRARVGAMRAFAADLAKGGKAGARAEKRLRSLMGRAEQYRRVAANVSRKHVAAKTLTADQAKAAAFQDYAVSRYADQGVRYDERRAPTDADAAVYGAAKGKARSAVREAGGAAEAHGKARLVARGEGVRGQRVAAQRRARKVKPGVPITKPVTRTVARAVEPKVTKALEDFKAAHPELERVFNKDTALSDRESALLDQYHELARAARGTESVTEQVRVTRSKAEVKAARKAAVEQTLQRRAASAEVYVHEERMRAAAASARAEHAKAGLAGDELTAAVRVDPLVVKEAAAFKAVRKRIGKAAAPTRAERRADTMWMRERIAAKKVADARKAVAEAKAAVPRKPREFARGLVVDDGAGAERKLTQAEIEQRFRDEYGPDAAAPAFVSARPDAQGAGAYFVNWLGRSQNRKSADTYGKTGRSEALGINAHGEQAAIDALVHTQGVLSAAKNWDRFIGAFGIKSPSGKLMTWDEADALARSLRQAHNDELPGRGAYTPVRVAPGRYDTERIEAILRGQAPGDSEAPKGVISSRVAKALAEEPPEDRASARNVVLVPTHVLETFGKHQEMTTNELAKLGQAMTNVFRSTVLPLSTKWLTGNVAEGILRLGVAGATPFDVALGRRFVRDLLANDAEWGHALLTRAQGGLLYGTADRLAVHRDRTMFDETSLEGAARAGQTIRHLPVVKQAIDGYMAFAHTVFTFNKWIEQQFQAAVVGKEVRRRVAEDTQSWSKSWQVAVGLSRDAYRDALQGATNTPSQVRFARQIDETLGKYSRFSPGMRRVTQTLAPFLPWYANAVRFVYWTLPVGHPVLTALLTSVERQFAADMQAQADSLPDGDLAANPQQKDGGVVPIARYTPFGAFTGLGRDGKLAAEALLDPLLPQLSTAMGILRYGKDAFGRDLATADGSDPNRTALAAYSMLEAFIPFAQLARRVREKGSTGYSDSTFWAPKTKPNTSYGRSAAGRIFNPFEPTYLKGPIKAGAAPKRRARVAAVVGDPRLAAVQALQAQQTVSAVDPRMAEVAKIQAAAGR